MGDGGVREFQDEGVREFRDGGVGSSKMGVLEVPRWGC